MAGIGDALSAVAKKSSALFDDDEDPLGGAASSTKSTGSAASRGAKDLFSGAKSAGSLFADSPRSSAKGKVNDLFSDSEAGLLQSSGGGITHRKMVTESSAGALSAGNPDLVAAGALGSEDLFEAEAVKPGEALKQMQRLVDGGEASAEAMSILRGVIRHFKK